jgi:hypothetical protein
MVWLIRVLIIGTFSVAGERLFTLAEDRPARPFMRQQEQRQQPRPVTNSIPTPTYVRPAPRPVPAPASLRTPPRAEPAYHPVGMTAQAREENASVRR